MFRQPPLVSQYESAQESDHDSDLSDRLYEELLGLASFVKGDDKGDDGQANERTKAEGAFDKADLQEARQAAADLVTKAVRALHLKCDSEYDQDQAEEMFMAFEAILDGKTRGIKNIQFEAANQVLQCMTEMESVDPQLLAQLSGQINAFFHARPGLESYVFMSEN